MAEQMDKNLDYNVKQEEAAIDTNRKMRVGIIGCGWIAAAGLGSTIKCNGLSCKIHSRGKC